MRKMFALVLALALVATMGFATGETEEGSAASGAPVRSGSYGEAPMLAAMVASGELPPIEERLPETPRVLEVEEIGTYGGTLQQVRNLDASDWLAWVMTKEPLTIVAPDLLSTLPNVAKEFSVSEDGTTITFTLRRGMRWSDGAPFGVDDIMFWYEDLISNKELTPEPISYFTRNNELMVVTQVADDTVTFAFSQPNSPFVNMIGTWWMYFVPQYSPKHYMSQFHPTYTDRETLDDLVKSEGFTSWPELYQSKDCVGHPSNGVNDPDCPTLAPWLFQDPKTAPVQTAVRNPYYWKVDPQGNQLPYIDRVERPLISDTEAWLLKVVAGEEDVVIGSFLDPGKNFTFLKENESRGGYTVKAFTWWRNHSTLYFNHTTDDPVKAALYANKDFRVALSHAIDRDEINGLLFGGRYNPSQLAPNSGPPFHGERDMFRQFIEHDPDTANQMLDEIGLSARGRDGFRLGADGNALRFILYHPSWPPENPEIGELIKGYWAEVGINLAVKALDAAAYTALNEADGADMRLRVGYYVGPPMVPIMSPNLFAGNFETESEWSSWLNTDGASGVEPPDDVKRLREIQNEIYAEPDPQKQLVLYDEAFTIHTDNLWELGILEWDAETSYSYIQNNRIGNVPDPMPGEMIPAQRSAWFIKS